jgi:hypothetical protein
MKILFLTQWFQPLAHSGAVATTSRCSQDFLTTLVARYIRAIKFDHGSGKPWMEFE